MPKLTFKLTRIAKKFGGDRYEHNLKGNENDKFVVYVPQSISRKGKEKSFCAQRLKRLGVAAEEMDITFEPK